MSERKPYQELEAVAAHLRRDGLLSDANTLLKAHEGIFNNTELYMAWRHALKRILSLTSISDDTRIRAKLAYDVMDRALR